jgi:hypothetical protein
MNSRLVQTWGKVMFPVNMSLEGLNKTLSTDYLEDSRNSCGLFPKIFRTTLNMT